MRTDNDKRPVRPGEQEGRARPPLDRPVIDSSREDRPGRGGGGDAASRNNAFGPLLVDPRVAELIATHQDKPGALLPLLHAIQAALGHIPPTAVPAIARGLSLSRAEVHGVIAYYSHFHEHPLGRHVVQICRAESCKACGADELVERAHQALDCDVDTTRADGAVTLESVYCLGLCAISPAVSLDGKLHGRVTDESLDRLLSRLDLSPVAGRAHGAGAAIVTPAAPRDDSRALMS